MRIGLYDKILTGYCARQTLSISCQANIMGTTEQNRCVSRRDTRTQLRSRPSRRCGALRTAVCPAAGAQDHVNDRKENLDGKDDREYGSQPPWNPDPLPGDFAHHRILCTANIVDFLSSKYNGHNRTKPMCIPQGHTNAAPQPSVAAVRSAPDGCLPGCRSAGPCQ